MSKSWEQGSTSQWRRVRARILAENKRTNGGRCTLGIAGVCTTEADTVHHVLGRAVTGDDPRYLGAVCRACNLAVGQPGKHEVRPQSKRVSSW